MTVVDCVAFLAAWVVDGVWKAAKIKLPPGTETLYWVTAVLGLILSVYGFIALTKGGQKQLSKSTVVILFALIPGCAALIRTLSAIGSTHL